MIFSEKNGLSDEEVLLSKMAEGNQNAFRSIFNSYNNKIYSFSFRILHSDILAEEVVQETMLKLWKLGTSAGEINNLDGYLKRIARNHCIDLLRRQQRQYRADRELLVSWSENHNETEEQILLNETRRVLDQGISLLPDQQRLVYELCHQQGCKYEEAAKRLNISPLTVQTYMKLALRFLRAHVSSQIDVILFLFFFYNFYFPYPL